MSTQIISDQCTEPHSGSGCEIYQRHVEKPGYSTIGQYKLVDTFDPDVSLQIGTCARDTPRT